jgi:hypothetical protein
VPTSSSFRTFTDDLQSMARDVLVRNSSSHGGAAIPAFLHMQRGDVRESQHVGLPASPEARATLLKTAVVPLVAEIRPELVGWTFEGQMTTLADPPVVEDASIVVVVAIDRERAEVLYAPLARALGQTLMGDWIGWPASEQSGALITPIQEALR